VTTVANLRAMSDEQVIAAHDALGGAGTLVPASTLTNCVDGRLARLTIQTWTKAIRFPGDPGPDDNENHAHADLGNGRP
jgi:hypothetical protein